MAATPTCVALDVGPLHGPRTGVATAVEGLLGALSRLDGAPEALPYLVSFRARPGDGVRRLPLPAALAMRCWSRADLPRADRWLRPAQVVHGTNYTLPPSSLPSVVSVYDCWFLEHPEQVHPHVRRAGEVLRRAVRRGATIHTSSLSSAERARALLGAERVVAIPLGAPPAPQAPVSTARPIPELDGQPFVLALGTLERRKNLPRLVEAFGLLADEHPDVRLVLAGGEGDDHAAVDEAILALPRHTTGRVLLTGRVDDPTKSWLLHHASVLAYPSLDEGFGFPLLEAMSVDLPVVASTAGSIPEVAGDAALLVDPREATALAAALATALGDDGRRAQLVRAGRERVAAHDWSATAGRMVELYASVAREATPG